MAKKIIKKGVYFYRINWLSNDYYGNPRAVVSAMDENGESVIVDAKAYGYNISNYRAQFLTMPDYDENGKQRKNENGAPLYVCYYQLPEKSAEITFHETKTGNIIIDYICDFEKSKKDKIYH